MVLIYQRFTYQRSLLSSYLFMQKKHINNNINDNIIRSNCKIIISLLHVLAEASSIIV